MSMYPRETSRPPRNEYDGEPFFCVKCNLPLASPDGGQKSGSCLMHNDQFETCVLETREAAMERRAHWLLKEEFGETGREALAQEQWERDRGPYGAGR